MFINVFRHVTGFHIKALMKTTMLHPYSLVAEWTMQETLLFGDQLFLGNGIIFFPAPVLTAQTLIKTAVSCYLKTCFKRYSCCIGGARIVSEADISVIFCDLFCISWHSDLNVSVDKQLHMCDLTVLCFLKYITYTQCELVC